MSALLRRIDARRRVATMKSVPTEDNVPALLGELSHLQKMILGVAVEDEGLTVQVASGDEEAHRIVAAALRAVRRTYPVRVGYAPRRRQAAGKKLKKAS